MSWQHCAAATTFGTWSCSVRRQPAISIRNPATSTSWLCLRNSIPPTYAEAYLGFYEALTVLFARPVKLVSTTAITNPYFLESIQRNRETLYAA